MNGKINGAPHDAFLVDCVVGERCPAVAKSGQQYIRAVTVHKRRFSCFTWNRMIIFILYIYIRVSRF